MKRGKDVTKDYQQNLEKVWIEIDKLNQDMIDNNQRSLNDIFDAYRDYRLSFNFD